MDVLTIVGLAFALAMDAFAVAVVVGCWRTATLAVPLSADNALARRRRQHQYANPCEGLTLGRLSFGPMFRLAFFFGLFQFMMTVIGWLAGLSVASLIAAYDHWVAFGLLVGIGLKMLWEARGEAPRPQRDPTRGLSLLALSVAVSIDALAAGLTLAIRDVTVWVPSVVIGVVASGMTVLGMILGRRVGLRLGRCARIVGGLILAALGTRILIEHLSA